MTRKRGLPHVARSHAIQPLGAMERRHGGVGVHARDVGDAKAKPLFLFMHLLFQKVTKRPPGTAPAGQENYVPPTEI